MSFAKINARERLCMLLWNINHVRRGYTVKYFFQSISWNTYFTIVSLCKLPRNVYDILLKPFMKYENSENCFSEFSLSWITFLLNFSSCLINSFILSEVSKNLKKNVNVKVKRKQRNMKWFFVLYIKMIRLEYFHQILILMQLQDFERIKLRGGMKNCFCFSIFLKKIPAIWKKPLVAVL